MFEFVEHLFNKSDISKKEKIVNQFKPYIDAWNSLKSTNEYKKIFVEYVDLKKYTIIEQIWNKAKNGDDEEEEYMDLIDRLKRIAVLENLADELTKIDQDIEFEEEQIEYWKNIENNFNSK